MTTPHEILGIEPDASDDQIRAAYRRAAMKHHPDRGGSPEEFQRIQAAYEKLQTRVCPLCANKWFVTTKQGVFIKKEPCPRCWSTK